MSTIENPVLGTLKQVRSKQPKKLWAIWILGNILGFIPFLSLILLKSLVVQFIWNNLLPQFGNLSFFSSYGLVAISTIITTRYHGESQLESIIDLIIKLLLFSLFTFVIGLT